MIEHAILGLDVKLDGEEIIYWNEDKLGPKPEGKASEILYRQFRALAYPSVPEQLDMIFKDITAWRTKIQEVKNQYPKPQE